MYNICYIILLLLLSLVAAFGYILQEPQTHNSGFELLKEKAVNCVESVGHLCFSVVTCSDDCTCYRAEAQLVVGVRAGIRNSPAVHHCRYCISRPHTQILLVFFGGGGQADDLCIFTFGPIFLEI